MREPPWQRCLVVCNAKQTTSSSRMPRMKTYSAALQLNPIYQKEPNVLVSFTCTGMQATNSRVRCTRLKSCLWDWICLLSTSVGAVVLQALGSLWAGRKSTTWALVSTIWPKRVPPQKWLFGVEAWAEQLPWGSIVPPRHYRSPAWSLIVHLLALLKLRKAWFQK